jgi:hypothetical protein
MEESQLYLCHLSSFIIQAIRNILSLLLFFIMSAPLHKICVEIILQIFKASPSVSSFVVTRTTTLHFPLFAFS